MEHISFEQLNQYLRDEKYFVVDQKVFDLYQRELTCLREKPVLLIEDPEREKSFAGLQKTTGFLLENSISRKDRVVAIGGGALSDLAGFAASVVLRGAEWICVPTTLLCAVDASIGGKTAINTEHGKNLVGAFHEPQSILFCPEFLQTLAPEEFASGSGEILKYAFLNKDIFQALRSEASLDEVVALCAGTKRDIVEKDFRERGERAKLNLGHTFGHALEKLTGIKHGICVAMGLEIAVDLFSPGLADDFNSLKQSLGLEYDFPKTLNGERFWEALGKDKKRGREGDISFIVPQAVGDVRIEKKSLNSLKEAFENHDKYRAILQ